MQVPFLDLKSQHKPIQDEIFSAWHAVYDNTAFAGNSAAFEQDFAAFCETQHAFGVNSGTDSLWAALLAVGVGPGDEVITVPNTFIATVEAIHNCGATPVFVDIDEETHNMDPSKIEAAITSRTKAIVPVHLYGQMAEMDPIQIIAKKHGIKVISDAAQAHGATYKNQKAGSMADAASFSFYPGKNLGACGEGGAVVTQDETIGNYIRQFRVHGQAGKHNHTQFGWNNRMDGLQAAALQIKLKYLPAWNEARRRHAQRYKEQMKNVEEIILPTEKQEHRHVYHVFAIRAAHRDALIEALGENGVKCGVHYPTPIHLQKAFAPLGYKQGDFPVTERCANELVSLPMFPELTEEQIDYVAEQVKTHVRGKVLVR